METESAEKIREWEKTEKVDAIGAFYESLDLRKKELILGFDNMQTWDPYLLGFSQGIRTAFEIVEDLIFSWADQISPMNRRDR